MTYGARDNSSDLTDMKPSSARREVPSLASISRPNIFDRSINAHTPCDTGAVRSGRAPSSNVVLVETFSMVTRNVVERFGSTISSLLLQLINVRMSANAVNDKIDFTDSNRIAFFM